MRSIPFVLVLSTLAACSEYNLAPQKIETPAEPSDVTDVPADEPETNEEDVDTQESTDTAEVPVEDTEEETDEPVDPNECTGFSINEGYDHYEETDSYAIFSLVSDSEIEVRQGETAKLQFAVTASNCGDIVFTGLTMVQSVID